MADRYWVGGNGTWSSTNITNWSATSGGAGGESVPTDSDRVLFDANSGSSFAQCTIENGYVAKCYSFSQVSPTPTLTTSGFSFSGSLEVGNTSGGINCGDFSANGIISDLADILIQGSTSGTPSVFSYQGGNTQICLTLRFLTGSFVLTSNLAISPNTFIDTGATLDCSGRTLSRMRLIQVDNFATLIATNSTFEIDRWLIQSNATLTGSSSVTVKLPSLGLIQSFFSDFRASKTYLSLEFGGFANVFADNVSTTTLKIAGRGVDFGGGQTITAGSILVVNPSTNPYARLTSRNIQFNLTSASATPIALNGLIISGINATGGAVYTADVTSIDAGSNTGIQFANSPGFLAFFT